MLSHTPEETVAEKMRGFLANGRPLFLVNEECIQTQGHSTPDCCPALPQPNLPGARELVSALLI